MKIIASFTILLLLLSCSDDCTTCTLQTPNDPIVQNLCDDGETNYTNEDGEIISYNEAVDLLENQGYNCD